MNGQQYIQAAEAVAALAPIFGEIIKLVANTVRGIEAAFPDSTGKQKLDAALGMIGSIYTSATAEAQPLFTGLINSAVAIMNVRGELDAIRKSVTAPTPAAPVASTPAPATGGAPSPSK